MDNETYRGVLKFVLKNYFTPNEFDFIETRGAYSWGFSDEERTIIMKRVVDITDDLVMRGYAKDDLKCNGGNKQKYYYIYGK